MTGVGLFFNFLFAMTIVLSLTYVAARMLKKIGFGRTSPSRYLEQIDYLALGPKRGIALVQIVDRTVALGVTDNQISLLLELDPARVAERAPGPEAVSFYENPKISQFKNELLKRFRRHD